MPLPRGAAVGPGSPRYRGGVVWGEFWTLLGWDTDPLPGVTPFALSPSKQPRDHSAKVGIRRILHSLASSGNWGGAVELALGRGEQQDH